MSSQDSNKELRKRLQKAFEENDPNGPKDSRRASGTKQPEPSLATLLFPLTLFAVSGIVFGGLIWYLVAVNAPSRFDPVAYSLPSPPALEGPLAPDSRIDNHGKRFFEGAVHGPEAIELCAGALYSGTLDGRIVRFEGSDTVHTVARIGPETGCGKIQFIHGERGAPECGRPLGIACLANRSLIVADALRGLLRVDLDLDAKQTQKKELAPVTVLLPVGTLVEGAPVSIPNHAAVLPDGRIAFSDSFSTRTFHELPYGMFEGVPSGRVIVYELASGRASVLMGGLNFANGVLLTHDRKGLLVAELNRARIWLYHLEGPKKGTQEVFADNLPGMPDDLGASEDGQTYWVALHGLRHAGRILNIPDLGASHPWLRTIYVYLMPPHKLLGGISRTGSLLVRLDSRGRAVDSLHYLADGVAAGVSGATEHDGALWLPSFRAPFVVRLALPLPPR